MKKWLLLLLAPALLSAQTTVTGTLTGIGGDGWQGTVKISSSNRCTPSGGGIVALSSVTVDMSNSTTGTFQHSDGTAVTLMPTDVCTETNTHYDFTYSGRGDLSWEEECEIASGGPVTLEASCSITAQPTATTLPISKLTGCTAKGSMLAASGTSLGCEAVGTDNFLLTAASGQTNGVQWQSATATHDLVKGYSNLSNANYFVCVASGGTVKECASTGTTQLGTKFFFDATNVTLGIGTASTDSMWKFSTSPGIIDAKQGDDAEWIAIRFSDIDLLTVATGAIRQIRILDGTADPKWAIRKLADNSFALYDDDATQNVMTAATGSGPVFPQGIFSTAIDGVDAGAATTRSNENNIQIARHNTDCTSLTDGVAGELCYEEDANTLYMCEPTAGGCDTAGEWISVSSAGGGSDAYGSLGVTGNAVATTVSVQNTWYQFTEFAGVGPENDMTGSTVTDDITIGTTGTYFAIASISFDGGSTDEYEVKLAKNNGATDLTYCYQNRLLGTGGDVGALTVSCIVSLTANDTVELWARNITVAANLTIVDASLNILSTSGGGSGGAAPVLMALDGTVDDERVLTAGSGVTVTDGGANSTVTIASDPTYNATLSGNNAFTGTNRHDPSATQSLTGVGNTILCNANNVQIDSDGDYTLTSTPTIADGADGQWCRITNVDAAQTVTLTHGAANNLDLGGSNYAIAPNQAVTLHWNDDLSDWVIQQVPGSSSSPLTTKGDLYGYDTGDARIPVGTNDDFLVADSVDAQGVAWKTVKFQAEYWYPAGANIATNVYGGSGWFSPSGGSGASVATRNGAAKNVIAGTTYLTASDRSSNVLIHLPSNWDGGSITFDFKLVGASGGTNGQDVQLNAETACVADTEADPAAWNTATTATVDIPTVLRHQTWSITPVITGCAAGETLWLYFQREGTHVNDTYASTLYVDGVVVKLLQTLDIQ